jgi:hypothetical protein
VETLVNLAKRTRALNVNSIMRVLAKDRYFIAFVIDLNTQGQLFDQGIDAKGNKLVSAFARFGEVYATRTIVEKEAKGLPTDRVTLFDEGDFYRSFKMALDQNIDFVITAQTIKDDNDLAQVWGEDILGLTDESLQLAIDYAKALIVPHIIKMLLGEEEIE